jgi:hypothetical protein
MDALVELCRTGRLGPLAPGMSMADVERLLGPPDDVDFIHGEPNRQRHRYGSIRLTLIGAFDAEAKPERLHLDAIQVRLTEPVRLPDKLHVTVGDDWVSPGRDEAVRRLREAGITVDVEAEFTDVAENQDLRVCRGTGGNVLIRVFDSKVRSINAFRP